MKLRLQPGARGAGGQHDAVDHGPDHLHRGHPLVAVAEHGLEFRDLPVGSSEGAFPIPAPVPGLGLITPLRHDHFLNKGSDHVGAEQAL